MDGYTLARATPTHKDFLNTVDFDQAEMLDIIKLSRTVRGYIKSGGFLNSLYHQSLGMIFEQKSTRTRMSFEVAMTQLGGCAIDLAPDAIQLGTHETIEDVARVLGRMCNVLALRVSRHESIVELAKYSEAPVINGMSDSCHPTQGVGDVITMFDHWPSGKYSNQVKVVFVGDATPTCNTLCDIATKMGMHFVHYGPASHKISDEWLSVGQANAKKYGGSATWSDHPSCLSGADFIYTDVWYRSYGDGVPKETYLAEFYPKYQVNDEMMALTGNSQCKFMHCLPASRNEEVSDSVLDSVNSLVWDEAENRLTAQRGVLLYFSEMGQSTLDFIKAEKEQHGL